MQGYGKHLPRGFHLSNCHISKALQGEWICWCLPKRPTHSSLQFLFPFLFQGFFFMTSISGLKSQQLWKTKRKKHSRAITGCVASQRIEQHLTLCTHFASCKPFHTVSSLSLGLHQIACELNDTPLPTRNRNPKLQMYVYGFILK